MENRNIQQAPANMPINLTAVFNGLALLDGKDFSVALTESNNFVGTVHFAVALPAIPYEDRKDGLPPLALTYHWDGEVREVRYVTNGWETTYQLPKKYIECEQHAHRAILPQCEGCKTSALSGGLTEIQWSAYGTQQGKRAQDER